MRCAAEARATLRASLPPRPRRPGTWKLRAKPPSHAFSMHDRRRVDVRAPAEAPPARSTSDLVSARRTRRGRARPGTSAPCPRRRCAHDSPRTCASSRAARSCLRRLASSRSARCLSLVLGRSLSASFLVRPAASLAPSRALAAHLAARASIAFDSLDRKCSAPCLMARAFLMPRPVLMASLSSSSRWMSSTDR